MTISSIHCSHFLTAVWSFCCYPSTRGTWKQSLQLPPGIKVPTYHWIPHLICQSLDISCQSHHMRTAENPGNCMALWDRQSIFHPIGSPEISELREGRGWGGHGQLGPVLVLIPRLETDWCSHLDFMEC